MVSSIYLRYGVWGLLIALALSGCRLSRADTEQSCSFEQEAQQVIDHFAGIYLYRDQVVVPQDWRDYSALPQLVDALRVNPPDRFSFVVMDAQAYHDYTAQGELSGRLGLSWTPNATADALIVLRISPGSPAAAAGLARGHRIVQIGAQTVAQIITQVNQGQLQWDQVWGESEAGIAVQLAWLDHSQQLHAASITKANIIEQLVTKTAIIEQSGQTLGYLALYNYFASAQAALQAAFTQFEQQGITQVIVDLRGNSGGSLAVASQLMSSLLNGQGDLTGQVHTRLRFNTLYQSENQAYRFQPSSPGLVSQRVAVLVDQGSASASELTINSLRPYVDLYVVGEQTYGKPVGSVEIEFCERLLFPISFDYVNVNDQGGFFDGLQPDCAIDDAVEYDWGDTRDPLVASAVNWLTGLPYCQSNAVATQFARRSAPGAAPSRTAVLRDAIPVW